MLYYEEHFGKEVVPRCDRGCRVVDIHRFCLGRFYKLACDGFAAIVPQVFDLHEGA